MSEREQVEQSFCREAVELFGCDEALICKPMGKLFLILGWKRHTRDNKTSVWTDGNGNEVHFEYLEEKCVASGKDFNGLRESMLYYKQLRDLPRENWVEHFMKLNKPAALTSEAQ